MRALMKVPQPLAAVLLTIGVLCLALAPTSRAWAQEPTPVPQPGTTTEPERVIQAGRLLGYPVLSLQGETLGTVEDLVVELSSVLSAARLTAPVEGPSRLTYAVINLPLPQGQGSRTVAAPLAGFAIDLEQGALRTAIQRGLLIAAPAWNPEALLEPSDVPWDQDVRAYWLRVSVPVPQQAAPGISVPGPALPLTQLLQYPITVLDADQPATFEDLLVDISVTRVQLLPELPSEDQPVLTPTPSSARVIYALVQFERQVLIPMSALHLDDVDQRFILAASRAILTGVPGFTGTEQGWDDPVRRFWMGLGFPVPPLGPETPDLFPSVTVPASVGSLLFTANELIGHTIVSLENQILGVIRDLVVEVALPGTDMENRVPFAVVGFGGFLGIGETLVTVPMSALSLDQVRDLFVLDASQEEVRQAPRFLREQLPSVVEPDSYTTVIEYWERVLTGP
ncbi:MAG: PRC-barrel domain-containing protein [Anaerolineae bacterium]|nr:PRC-barrel domain-containing protein [Anaerolineae bacterium]